MLDVVEEQVALEGEVQHPNLNQRYFMTLDGLADYIRMFKITHGAFAYGEVKDVGFCYYLEYPARDQS